MLSDVIFCNLFEILRIEKFGGVVGFISFIDGDLSLKLKNRQLPFLFGTPFQEHL
jgi:hypothetical protein